MLAIGFPLGASAFTSGEPTITSGIFSARRDFRGQSYVQTDTPVNHGNSGGPLINLKGEVIGINTLVVGRTVEQQAQGLNLAIPSSVVRSLLPGLRDQPAARPSATPSRTATTAASSRTYRSTSYAYSLQYPGHWKLDDSDAKEVSVSGDGGEVAVVVEQLSRSLSAGEFADGIVSSMQRNLTDFKLARRTDGRLRSGQTAVILTVSWREGGATFEGTGVVAVNGTRGYFVLGGADSERYRSVSGRVEDILNSFSLQ